MSQLWKSIPRSISSGTGLLQLTLAKQHLVVIVLKWVRSSPGTSSVAVKFQSWSTEEQPSASQYFYCCNNQRALQISEGILVWWGGQRIMEYHRLKKTSKIITCNRLPRTAKFMTKPCPMPHLPSIFKYLQEWWLSCFPGQTDPIHETCSNLSKNSVTWGCFINCEHGSSKPLVFGERNIRLRHFSR